MKKVSLAKGLTLIELLVGIGIAAVIVTLALSLFNTVSDENKIHQEVKNLGILVAGVKSMFASQINYTGLSEAVILSTNVIPDNMRLNATDLKHAWGSAAASVVLAPVAANTQFTVTYNTVPSEACVGVLMASLAGAASATVDGVAVTDTATIVTECSDAGDDTIVWTYL